MRLVTVERFRALAFEAGSRPDPRTVRAWVDSGAVRGRVVRRGRRASYFVDLEAWEAATGEPRTAAVLAGAG